MKHKYISEADRIANVLKFVGITVKNPNNTYKCFSQIIKEISNIWKPLNPLTKRYISNSVAGIRKSSEVEIYLNNLSKL